MALLSFEEAVSVLREKQPYRLIWYGREYIDEYIFNIAADNTYVKEDGAMAFYSVDKKTREVHNVGVIEKMKKDINNDGVSGLIRVDLTPEQFNYETGMDPES